MREQGAPTLTEFGSTVVGAGRFPSRVARRPSGAARQTSRLQSIARAADTRERRPPPPPPPPTSPPMSFPFDLNRTVALLGLTAVSALAPASGAVAKSFDRHQGRRHHHVHRHDHHQRFVFRTAGRKAG